MAKWNISLNNILKTIKGPGNVASNRALILHVWVLGFNPQKHIWTHTKSSTFSLDFTLQMLSIAWVYERVVWKVTTCKNTWHSARSGEKRTAEFVMQLLSFPGTRKYFKVREYWSWRFSIELFMSSRVFWLYYGLIKMGWENPQNKGVSFCVIV